MENKKNKSGSIWHKKILERYQNQRKFIDKVDQPTLFKNLYLKNIIPANTARQHASHFILISSVQHSKVY